MANSPTIETLEDLEAVVRSLSMKELLQRQAICATAGHAWRRLDASGMGIRDAEWCGRCLRTAYWRGVLASKRLGSTIRDRVTRRGGD